MDSEWRPSVTKWHEVLGPAIFQISGSSDTFIIDILALKNSINLDNMLSSIFQNPKTIVVGFGFSSDIAVFNKYCQNMKFLNYIPKFLELQDFYKKVYPNFA